MKIGIFGKNSFIGKSIAVHLESKIDVEVNFINSRNDEWKNTSFAGFDVIICVAGIAHVSPDPKMESLYYAINCDLPIAVAQKAKKDGVKHYVFFSSMIVYGDDAHLGQKYRIDRDTIPNPTNFYGMSKLVAEKGLLFLQDKIFTVSCVRIPMVYGPGCKGNFVSLVRLAKRVPFFPDIENERSMIYIGNLSEYIYQCVINKWGGVLFPQNMVYISTKSIIEKTARFYGKRMHFIKIFNPLIFIFAKRIAMINKLFGTKVYDFSISGELGKYNLYDFDKSIENTLREIN